MSFVDCLARFGDGHLPDSADRLARDRAAHSKIATRKGGRINTEFREKNRSFLGERHDIHLSVSFMGRAPIFKAGPRR